MSAHPCQQCGLVHGGVEVDLVPYERQQGGYWLYGRHSDVYGNGKVWVSALDHAMARAAHEVGR